MKILIVDDSHFLRLAGERALTKAGHQVFSTIDGEEGLRLAREHKPDLVILDLMLPKLSGPEVLRAIRTNPEIAKTPVMVLTSLPQCNEQKLMGEGATSYFQKSRLKLDRDTAPFVQEVESMILGLSKRKAAGR